MMYSGQVMVKRRNTVNELGSVLLEMKVTMTQVRLGWRRREDGLLLWDEFSLIEMRKVISTVSCPPAPRVARGSQRWSVRSWPPAGTGDCSASPARGPSASAAGRPPAPAWRRPSPSADWLSPSPAQTPGRPPSASASWPMGRRSLRDENSWLAWWTPDQQHQEDKFRLFRPVAIGNSYSEIQHLIIFIYHFCIHKIESMF